MTAPSRRWRSAAGLIATGMAGLLALGACSAPTQSEGPAARGLPAEGAPDVRDGNVAVPQEQPQKPGAPQQAPANVAIPQRSLIYTGSMTVRVDNVVAAADRAADIAVGAGGIVAGDQRTIDADSSDAQLIVRVPADRFDGVLDDLGKLGEEQSRAIQTQDVTETLVDLDARLATQEASVARVRALLARANTIGEIVSIESELTRRTAELDSLKQRKEKLAGMVALSTVTLHLLGPAAPGPAPQSGFVAGLKSGWAGLLTSVEIVLTIAGWLLPWVVAIGAPLWLLIWLLRRRRPRPAATTALPTPMNVAAPSPLAAPAHVTPAAPPPAAPAVPATPATPPAPSNP